MFVPCSVALFQRSQKCSMCVQLLPLVVLSGISDRTLMFLLSPPCPPAGESLPLPPDDAVPHLPSVLRLPAHGAALPAGPRLQAPRQQPGPIGHGGRRASVPVPTPIQVLDRITRAHYCIVLYTMFHIHCLCFTDTAPHTLETCTTTITAASAAAVSPISQATQMVGFSFTVFSLSCVGNPLRRVLRSSDLR